MRGFIKFNKGIMQMALPWKLWLFVLICVNAVIPLFFIGRIEAQLALGAFLISLVLFSMLTARFGFTRILGLGHVAWIPLIIFLFTRLDTVSGDEVLCTWIQTLMVLNGISLVIDTVDVIRYLAGARQEPASLRA